MEYQHFSREDDDELNYIVLKSNIYILYQVSNISQTAKRNTVIS